MNRRAWIMDALPRTSNRATNSVKAAAVGLAAAILAGCTASSSGSSTTSSSSAPPTTPTSSTAKCLSGTFAVVVPTTDNPVRSACLHLATTVEIALLALRGVTWSAPTVSDPSVAAITDQVTPVGTRHDRLKLLRPGTVTVTSLSSYNPDPHGPPSEQWSLTLTVVP
jgi:hypothetical protein